MSPKTPKWREIADNIAAKIASGVYQPGDPLPHIRTLVAEGYGSKATINTAYSALETEGLVTTSRGHGTTVRRRPPQNIRRHQERYNWEKKLARSPIGERSNNGVVERDTGLDHDQVECHAVFNTEPATAEMATRFGIEVGTLMLHRSYWHSTPGESVALSLIDSYVVHAVAAQNPELLDSAREPWPGGTHHQLSTIGIEIDRINDAVRARTASAAEAKKLGIPPGTAVLLLDKTSISTSGDVVEYSHVVLPAERTELQYTVPLERWAT
ncbi:GntR family transcriptional regulator [Kitasatospora purpeofusca]|uniref:GntR family transcriptional regulator n=1 Tax=Kitasatospora purpeofusca TaxID=67352 RepID=UPI0035D7CD04